MKKWNTFMSNYLEDLAVALQKELKKWLQRPGKRQWSQPYSRRSQNYQEKKDARLQSQTG
jgi:hypothetical protein